MTTTDPGDIGSLKFLQGLDEASAGEAVPGVREREGRAVPQGVLGHLMGRTPPRESVELSMPADPGPVGTGLRGSSFIAGETARLDPAEEAFWGLVSELRGHAAERLQKEGLSTRGHGVSDADRKRGEEIIASVVEQHGKERMQVSGERSLLDSEVSSRVRKEIFNGIFRLGRYQALIDDLRVQNIHVNGYDQVWVEYADGTMKRVGPVATSDKELMDDIRMFSTYNGDEGRPFSHTHPDLDMDLMGYVRLAAVAPPISKRPAMVLRVHRYIDITLEQLVKLDYLSADAADFLSAAVRAGANVVISGQPGTGKTTFMRALARCIPDAEQIVTIEEDRELHLGMVPRQGPAPIELQARPGMGEAGSVGAYDTQKAFRKALRLNSVRILVGEARGDEVVAMIQAMQSGAGTFSTVHARSSVDAIGRLAGMGSKHFSEDYLRHELAELMDLVVQVERLRTGPEKGKRRVSAITQILRNPDSAGGFAGHPVFELEDGRLVPHLAPVMESFAEVLEEEGFNFGIFRQGAHHEG